MRNKLTYRMRKKRFYRIVAEKLHKKGVHAFMMRRHQLVFTKRCNGYCSGGGWLTFHKEKWYFATWHPQVYLIRSKQDIPQLCKDYLSYKMIGLTMPDELVVKYSLEIISEMDMDLMFNDQCGNEPQED